MYNQNIRLVAKWLSATLMLFCLMLLAGHDVYAKEYKLGDIPLHPEVYKKHLKVWPMEMAEMLPTAYDARDDGIFTPAKDQGSCGSCWAFASVGAMESHMLKAYQAGPEDLSEQQQVSCNTSMWGCDGGSSNAIKYWEQKGPLDEGCFPYTANDSTPCGESNCTQLGYRVIDWHTVSTNDFKNSLYIYGPSYWRFNVYSDFDTFWRDGTPDQVYTSQPGSTYRGGHAVLLIGWDDTKGAYLCKNSWGSGGPNNDGTFWIAYSGHSYDLGFGMVNFSLTSLTCSSDNDCDDGIYCNGVETCDQAGACLDGVPPDCSDDGLFCNGSEVCDEANQSCGQTGNPCEAGTVCDEDIDSCVLESCGNGQCETGENCNNCLQDCIGGTSSGGDCASCFKGNCDGVCHPKKEDASCSDCATVSYCCGDGICEGEENNGNCAIDCPYGPTCGDDNCDLGENCSTCPEDCATPEDCSDGMDNDCDAFVDCDDKDDCSNDPACGPAPTCVEKGAPCDPDIECCSGRCHPNKNVCL